MPVAARIDTGVRDQDAHLPDCDAYKSLASDFGPVTGPTCRDKSGQIFVRKPVMNQPVHFSNAQTPTKFGVGQPVRRVEDVRFITGQGNYVDDIALDGQAHSYVLRSPLGAAKIIGIDFAHAAAMPGVLKVFDSAELEKSADNLVPIEVETDNRDGSKTEHKLRPVLATGQVRYVGEPVAFIVAETRTQARDAAEAIEVNYEMLDTVVSTGDADAPGQPLVFDDIPNNVAFDWQHGEDAAVDAAFAKAAHITRLNLINNRVVANSIETRAVNVDWDVASGQATVYANTQGGWSIKAFLANNILKIDKDNVQVITPDVGGGFGMKAFNYPEHALAALASRTIRRPVKWVGDRSESFLSDAMGRDHVTIAELALDANNRTIGLRVTTRANMGAYMGHFAAFIPTGAALKVLAGIYDVKVATYRVIAVYTNTTPVDAYRGAGRPESIYMIERLVDRAARERGMDPAEFRKLNLIPASAMPFKTVADEIYDTGEFVTVMDAACDRADVKGFAARKAGASSRGKRLGLGMSYYIESTMGDPQEFADIRFENCKVTLGVGTQSNGQGHETAYAQVLSEKLGIDFKDIEIIQGDTTRIPKGGGTGGSRSLTIQAAAINLASDDVIENGRNLAADELEASPSDIEFDAGALRVVGTDKSIKLMALAEKHPGALDARGMAEFDQWTFPNGCHIAEVEVDEQTGTPTVTKYTIVDDFGRVVNPMLVAGQVHGGVVQGIGQALTEHTVFDESGQLLTGSFMDYGMPRARDFPEFDFNYLEVPTKNNLMGIKGCGEAGSLASPPAVMNATCDAVWDGDAGHVPTVDMPATPQHIWSVMNR